MKKSTRVIQGGFILLAFFLLSMATFSQERDYSFDQGISLLIDGENIETESPLILENDRVLVPLRVVSESLGAKVNWLSDLRRVDIEYNNKIIKVWIDSHLIQYGDGSFGISDVAPVIVEDRTYVPVRLIANAMEIYIGWEANTRSVLIDSSRSALRESFYGVDILELKNRGVIEEKSNIVVEMSSSIKERASLVKLLLINKETAKGHVVYRSTENLLNIPFIPKGDDQGLYALVAAYYDKDNNWLAGDAVGVNIQMKPKVNLIVDQRGISDAIVLKTDANFSPFKMSYELINVKSGSSELIETADPFNSYTWSISGMKTGDYLLKAKAYDQNLNVYESNGVNVSIKVSPYLYLSGVKNNGTVNGPTYLIASRNFDVKETIYLIEDVSSGKLEILETVPWGGYTWAPTLDDLGSKNLYVKVIDINDKVHTSPGVNVTVDMTPNVSLSGVGPGQVLTEGTELIVKSNTTIKNIRFSITNTGTGYSEVLLGNKVQFNPTKNHVGAIKIKGFAETEEGKALETETIELRVYLDDIYGSRPIVEKSEFLPLVSKLALKSYNETGMSAALQAAQGILETGWGQKVPVDKYSNQFSYNLFGIKGTGTNGSVISNTWEVYNGISFRTDAYFRAYNNIEESWYDHKSLLLEKSRYQIFRDVMYDYQLGAWAIRRAGYATDPLYPIKLMNIIKQYDLHILDEVGVK
jgi:hypothetical protein